MITSELHSMDEKYGNDVVRIESLSHSHPWAESLLRKSETQVGCNRVWLENGQVVGYFFSQCVAGEASLLNIAVDPSFQGKGFGKKLLQAFLDCMRERGAQEVWLEVRESNVAAISLYQGLEFNEFDRRVNYYPTKKGHKEDALIMSYWFE